MSEDSQHNKGSAKSQPSSKPAKIANFTAREALAASSSADKIAEVKFLNGSRDTGRFDVKGTAGNDKGKGNEK